MPTIMAPIALIFSFPGIFMILVSPGKKSAKTPRSTTMIPTPTIIGIMISPEALHFCTYIFFSGYSTSKFPEIYSISSPLLV